MTPGEGKNVAPLKSKRSLKRVSDGIYEPDKNCKKARFVQIGF